MSGPETINRSLRPLARDWRIWMAVLLSVAAVAGYFATLEIRRHQALVAAEAGGMVVIPRSGSRRSGPPDFEPLIALLSGILNREVTGVVTVESRLPDWMIARLPYSVSKLWLVTVKEVSLTSPPKKWLGSLRMFPEIETLDLTSASDPEWFATSFPNLRRLSIATDAALQTSFSRLRELPRLRIVEIQASDLSEEALQSLSELTQLESLTIHSPGVIQRLSPAIRRLQRQKHVTLGAWDWQRP